VTGFRRRIDAPAVVWLTGVWVFLWGRVDVAVLLSGAVLGALVCVLAPLRVRPVPLLWLVRYLAWDLVHSSIQVTWQIMRPAPPRPSVLAITLQCQGEVMSALTAIAVSAVPGTTVIDVRREDSMMFIHVLDAPDTAALDCVRQDVWHLERLIVRAFGTREQVAALAGARPSAPDRGSHR
jgi:multicomponent Na+:H+ antiporter subunit E